MHNGIMNKYEVLDNIIESVETVRVSGMKDVIALANVFQMLHALKQGMKGEDESKTKIIENLKEQLKRANTIEPDEGGDKIGGQEVHFDFGGEQND